MLLHRINAPALCYGARALWLVSLLYLFCKKYAIKETNTEHNRHIRVCLFVHIRVCLFVKNKTTISKIYKTNNINSKQKIDLTHRHTCARHVHMQCTCSAHAVHMQCTCSAHAVHMQCTCSAHAVHMQCICSAHAVYMKYTCSAHAVHMQCTCSAHAVYMQYTCSAHAVHMQCTCSAHAVHMQCTCSAHAVHMQCTCSAHAVNMQCTCSVHAVHIHPCTLSYDNTPVDSYGTTRRFDGSAFIAWNLGITSLANALHDLQLCRGWRSLLTIWMRPLEDQPPLRVRQRAGLLRTSRGTSMLNQSTVIISYYTLVLKKSIHLRHLGRDRI